ENLFELYYDITRRRRINKPDTATCRQLVKLSGFRSTSFVRFGLEVPAGAEAVDAPFASGWGWGGELQSLACRFLCSTREPFLRPDPRGRSDAARSRGQGWPLRGAGNTLSPRQATP